MTQGRPWIRFALPGVVESLIERGLISGLAKPGARLEQIWNTLLEILPAFIHLRHLPSEELLPGASRRQPLKQDLTPLSLGYSIIPACYVTTLSSSVALQSPSVRQMNAFSLHRERGTSARKSANACLSAFPGNHRAY
jgi:hypothetical protein